MTGITAEISISSTWDSPCRHKQIRNSIQVSHDELSKEFDKMHPDKSAKFELTISSTGTGPGCMLFSAENVLGLC